MVATAFDEDNDVLGPPPGVSDEQVSYLSVYKGPLPGDGRPVVVSCWKPTAEEVAEIARTGRVWLVVLGQTMPPAFVGGVSPFPVAPSPTPARAGEG